MTANFSFSRLVQLIKKQWIENARLYIFSVLALLGLLGLVFLFWITTSGDQYQEDGAYIIFIGGLFIAGTVFASMSFSMLGDKAKGTYWLGFPASHLEKLLCMIFYCAIVFTIVYVGCFFAVKSIAFAYVRQIVADAPAQYSLRKIDWSDPKGFIQVMKVFGFGFFAVQAFYLLGSVYFSRYSFILTTVIGAAMMFAFGLYLTYLVNNAFPDGYSWNGSYVRNFNEMKNYSLSSSVQDLLIFAVKYVWAPLFWVATWYRLKEKQI